MRIRSLALAILLSTTCIAGAADRAEAGPLVVFAQGFWTGLTTGVAAGAGIGGAFAVGMNAGAWLAGGSLLARLVVSVGVSALMARLNRPKIPPAEYMANYAQAVSWVEWAYGRVRKGGPFALSAFSRAGAVTAGYTDAAAARRHYGVIIACHSTRGPVTHYLDKWEVETDANGLVPTAPVSTRCRIRSYTGQAGQPADPVWRAVFPEVGVGDDFAGLSYAALYANRPADSDFPDVYPNGREWAYAPVWDGCDTIWDPRLGGDDTQRTNIALHSEDLTHGSYTLQRVTVGANVAPGPGGEVTADTIIETTASGTHFIQQSYPFVAGQTYTISAYVERATGSRHLGMAVDTAAFTTSHRASWDLDAGTVGSESGSPNARIVAVGGGRYRVSMTVTATATVTGWVRFFISNSAGSPASSYAGDGSSSLVLTGLQVEVGPNASVYKPTTDVPVSGVWGRVWSNNAALVIADVATRIFGKSVDWDEVAEQADICDQLVTNRDGGTQRRWTINTVIRADQTWEDVRAHLQMCCDAFFYERRDGKLGFKVGYYAAPTITLTDRDFLSLTIRHKAEGPDRPGSYAMRYVEPARDWEQEVSGAVVVDPVGQRSETECYGIDSHNQAWRVIWRAARLDHAEWAISGILRAKGYECMEERFLRVTHDEAGLDCVIEIGTLGRIAGSHTWQLEAVSVEAADFAPDALTLEPPRTLRAAIAEDGTVPAPASLSGEVIEGTGGVALIEYAWPAQTVDLTQQLRVRSLDAGLPDWQIVTVPGGQGSYVLSGLIDGADYEAQVRNRTAAGRLSTWAPETPLVVTAVANTDPPPAVTGFAAALAGSTVELDWTAPNSHLYTAARIWRASGAAAVIGDAVLVRVEFGAPSLADSWTDPGPGTGDWRYWIEPINGSGIGGPMSGPEDITII